MFGMVTIEECYNSTTVRPSQAKLAAFSLLSGARPLLAWFCNFPAAAIAIIWCWSLSRHYFEASGRPENLVQNRRSKDPGW